MGNVFTISRHLQFPLFIYGRVQRISVIILIPSILISGIIWRELFIHIHQNLNVSKLFCQLLRHVQVFT